MIVFSLSYCSLHKDIKIKIYEETERKQKARTFFVLSRASFHTPLLFFLSTAALQAS